MGLFDSIKNISKKKDATKSKKSKKKSKKVEQQSQQSQQEAQPEPKHEHKVETKHETTKATESEKPKSSLKSKLTSSLKSSLMPKRINRTIGDSVTKFYVKKYRGSYLLMSGIMSATSEIRQIIPMIDNNAQTKLILDLLNKHQQILDEFVYNTTTLNFSDEYTPINKEDAEKYLSVFDKFFFKNIMQDIQDHLMQDLNSIFYNELLKTMNGYLSHSGFYTPEIMLGDDSEPVMKFMEVDYKPTKEKVMKGAIAQIEQLPYIIGVKNDEPMFIKGKMTVYK